MRSGFGLEHVCGDDIDFTLEGPKRVIVSENSSAGVASQCVRILGGSFPRAMWHSIFRRSTWPKIPRLLEPISPSGCWRGSSRSIVVLIGDDRPYLPDQLCLNLI